jgi:hypothetical protein
VSRNYNRCNKVVFCIGFPIKSSMQIKFKIKDINGFKNLKEGKIKIFYKNINKIAKIMSLVVKL